MAPALGLAYYPEPRPRIQARNVYLVYGWQDDVVPPDCVIEQASQQQLPLRLVNDGHRLQDSLDIILHDFRTFLVGCLNLEVRHDD